jgi:hypothetical protein
MLDRADAGAVIAAILEPLEAIEQALSDFTFADNSNDSAHSPSEARCSFRTMWP